VRLTKVNLPTFLEQSLCLAKAIIFNPDLNDETQRKVKPVLMPICKYANFSKMADRN
jgi:hypothetical protein